MPKVPVTSQSGTGKSAALHLLRQRGHRVLFTDADRERESLGEYAAGNVGEGRAEPEVPRAQRNGGGRGWYRGDCHVHSVYSDGELTPERLAASARAAGLDFVATTEHNTSGAHDAWRARGGEDLLVILGEEVTTVTGHWLALGIQSEQLVSWRYTARDGVIGQQLGQVHQVGGLCVAAHPHAPYPSGAFHVPLPGL